MCQCQHVLYFFSLSVCHQALWQAPANFSGKVRFRATLVQDYKTFWKDVVSPVVRVVSSSRRIPPEDEEEDDLQRLTRRPRQKRPAGNEGEDGELPHSRLKVGGIDVQWNGGGGGRQMTALVLSLPLSAALLLLQYSF